MRIRSNCIYVPFIVCLSFATLCISGVSKAETVYLSPDADAFINGGDPNQNHGSNTALMVGELSSGGNLQTRIRFDGIPTGANIESAELRLYTTMGSGSHTISTQLASQPWSENTLTWNTSGSTGRWTSPNTTYSMSSSTTGYIYINVTDQVQEWADGTRSNYGFHLSSDGTYGENHTFGSSENSNSSYRPRLGINYSGSSDDAYEPNNSRGDAYDLSSDERTWLSSIGGMGIQNDDDWYRIYVNSGYERVQVDCRFSDAEGDIDISLYNESGNHLISATSTTDNEFVDYTVSGGGTYYIRVYYDNEGNAYDLWWDDLSVPTNDNAEIVSFSPPVGSPQRGDQVQASVRVKNTGTSTRSYWIGLSFAEPGATLEGWPDGWYDIPPIESNVLSPNSEQTVVFNIPIWWWLVPGAYTAVTAVWEDFNDVDNLMVEPRYDDDTKSSFTLDSYLFGDIENIRIIPPQVISSLNQPAVFVQELDFTTWLGQKDAVGPQITIDQPNPFYNGEASLRIGVTEADGAMIDNFWGRECSDVFLILPDNAHLSDIELTIDGQNTYQFSSYVAFKTACLVSGPPAASLSEFIIEHMVEETLERALDWATSFTQLPPEYDLRDEENYVVLAIDFDASSAGAAYDTFDEFELSTNISFPTGQPGQIGILSNIRYKLNKLSYPAVTFSPFPLLGSGLLQEQEYRFIATMEPEVLGFTPTDVGDDEHLGLPVDYSLSQNYPNPFNPSTQIDFALPRSADVRIDIYNILGEKVKTLIDEQMAAGNQSVIWDGTNYDGLHVSTGIYLYRIQAVSYTHLTLPTN